MFDNFHLKLGNDDVQSSSTGLIFLGIVLLVGTICGYVLYQKRIFRQGHFNIG